MKLKAKIYIQMLMLVVLVVSMFGFVGPYLVSEKSDMAVLLGFVSLSVTPVLCYLLVMKISKNLSKL